MTAIERRARRIACAVRPEFPAAAPRAVAPFLDLVVVSRAEMAKVRGMISTTGTTCNDVINDATWRSAARRLASST